MSSLHKWWETGPSASAFGLVPRSRFPPFVNSLLAATYKTLLSIVISSFPHHFYSVLRD